MSSFYDSPCPSPYAIIILKLFKTSAADCGINKHFVR